MAIYSYCKDLLPECNTWGGVNSSIDLIYNEFSESINIMIDTDIVTEAIDIKSIASMFVEKARKLFNRFKEFVSKLPGKIKEFIKKKMASIKGKHNKPFNIKDYKNFDASDLKDTGFDISDKGYIPNIDFVVSGDYKGKIQNLVDEIHSGVNGLYEEISSDKYLSGDEDEMKGKLGEISERIDKYFEKELYDKDSIRSWFFIKSRIFEMGSNPQRTWNSLVTLGDMSDVTDGYTKIINKTIDKCQNTQNNMTVGVDTNTLTSEYLKSKGIEGSEITSLYSKRFQLFVNLFGKEIAVLGNLLSDIAKIVTDFTSSVIDIEKQITNRMDDPLDSPTIVKKISINPVVKKYINEKDTELVRSTLARLVYVGDKDSFYDFKNSTEYASKKLKDLYQEDSGEAIESSNTIENYKDIARKMMDNFSKAKYDKLISIGQVLYGKR